MIEHFFAPCPRGLEAALAAELGALGAAEITTTDGGVAFAGPIELAYRTNLESRLASRILWHVGQGTYRDENDVYELANALDWPRWFRVDRTLARRRRRDTLAADQSRIRYAAHQGRGVRPPPCRRWRPAQHQQGPSRRPRARLSDRDRRELLPRHLGRAAVQARLSARNRRRAVAREPGRRPAAPGRVATWNAAARSDVRQRNHRHRSRADRAGHRAGTQADVRLPEARLVRRPDLAAHQAGGAAARQAPVAVDDLRQRQRRDGHSPVQREHRRGRASRVRSCRARRRADARRLPRRPA